MKQSEIIWLAGLFDGEGCIHINRQRASARKDLKTDSFRLYAQITLGHLATLQRVQRIVGCGSVQPHTVSNKKANKAWCWMSSAGDAANLLKLLRPYLFTKKAEANIGLKFAALPSWQPGGLNGASRKPQSLLDREATAYWRLRFAKSRWRFYARSLSKTQVDEIVRLGLGVEAAIVRTIQPSAYTLERTGVRYGKPKRKVYA